MSEHPVILAETWVLPTGFGQPEYTSEYALYALRVMWQGERGWTVTHFDKDTRLSVKGRKWASVAVRNRRFYYFPSYEEALQAAKEAVDDVKINGYTWHKLQEAKKKKEQENG